MELLENNGLVSEVRGADWNLEIGGLTELVAFSKNPRALLFDDIKGYPSGFRVATNLFVTPGLQGLALGLPQNLSGVDLVNAWRQHTKTLHEMKPKQLDDGPVKENIIRGDNVDILKFPIPMWHSGDGGRYFGTGDCFITRDPNEGWVNAGTYRCQVHDKRTLGLFCVPSHHGMAHVEKSWAQGKDAQVVITEGQDPSLYAASCSPLPWGHSEFDFAGGLRGEPLDVIIDEETGLPVPATAEIAIFGHLVKGEFEVEGPFGECTGYYSPASKRPVIHIDRIWHRNDPIYQGSPTMRASAMLHGLGAEIFTSASAWDSIEREVTNVTGVYSLFQPCQAGSPIMVVSIKQSFPGHAKQAAFVVASAHAVFLWGRMVVVVDDDIDPANLNDVLWAMSTRCNPAEDVTIVKGTAISPLDPSLTSEKRETGDMTSGIMIIDATKKPYSQRDRYPPSNRISGELEVKIKETWGGKLQL